MFVDSYSGEAQGAALNYGQPNAKWKKYFKLLKLPAEQLSSPGLESRIWFMFNFTIFLFLAPDFWTMTRASLCLLQLENCCNIPVITHLAFSCKALSRLRIVIILCMFGGFVLIIRNKSAHTCSLITSMQQWFFLIKLFVMIWPAQPTCTWPPYGEVSTRLSVAHHSVQWIAKRLSSLLL